jgi:hypothetical protein
MHLCGPEEAFQQYHFQIVFLIHPTASDSQTDTSEKKEHRLPITAFEIAYNKRSVRISWLQAISK